MLVTLILITALLSGAAVLVSLQLSANRSTDLMRTGMSSLACAEAGLAAAGRDGELFAVGRLAGHRRGAELAGVGAQS
jgi:hypothetical protein